MATLAATATPATPATLIAPAAPADSRAEAIRKVAQDFEAMVLGQLLQPMFNALDADGLGGGGAGEKMFRPMLVENYARGIATKGGIGVADAVFRELMAIQGDSARAAQG